jgi:hypothetical protein
MLAGTNSIHTVTCYCEVSWRRDVSALSYNIAEYTIVTRQCTWDVLQQLRWIVGIVSE